MKKIKKLLRAKRAFSAVIAALILMLLAVAAGVVVYAYVMGWIGGATTSTGGTQGRLQFDSIYATSGTPGTIKVYARNIGGTDLMLSKIYVDGAEKANATAIAEAGVPIGIQSTEYLEISNVMTKNYFYEVKVTCKDGTTVTQSVQAK